MLIWFVSPFLQCLISDQAAAFFTHNKDFYRTNLLDLLGLISHWIDTSIELKVSSSMFCTEVEISLGENSVQSAIVFCLQISCDSYGYYALHKVKFFFYSCNNKFKMRFGEIFAVHMVFINEFDAENLCIIPNGSTFCSALL